MKRLVLLLVAVLFVSVVQAGCSSGTKDSEVISPMSESYDWDAARKKFTGELDGILRIIVAGEQSTYRTARTEWATKVVPNAHPIMFSADDPPKNCSAAVVYTGYSAPEYNSYESEYVAFRVTRMNNDTLASIDWNVTIRIERGNEGYYVAEFIREAR